MMDTNTNKNEGKKYSQNKMVLESLQLGHKVTALDALHNFDCFRLAARIANLRSAGFLIETCWQLSLKTGKRVAYYVLTDQK